MRLRATLAHVPICGNHYPARLTLPPSLRLSRRNKVAFSLVLHIMSRRGGREEQSRKIRSIIRNHQYAASLPNSPAPIPVTPSASPLSPLPFSGKDQRATNNSAVVKPTCAWTTYRTRGRRGSGECNKMQIDSAPLASSLAPAKRHVRWWPSPYLRLRVATCPSCLVTLSRSVTRPLCTPRSCSRSCQRSFACCIPPTAYALHTPEIFRICTNTRPGGSTRNWNGNNRVIHPVDPNELCGWHGTEWEVVVPAVHA